MTLDEAKQMLGCKWDYELAAILGITPPSISGWNPECIPEKREFQVLKKISIKKYANLCSKFS